MMYRRIRLDKEIDEKTGLILRQIGLWHSSTPKLWRENFILSESDIEETVEEIKIQIMKTYFYL